MYRTKQDVDKHVQSLISKLPLKEFNSRAYSVARLYYEVGDYSSCQKYVEQYLGHKDNNAAAHKLLGQAFQKLRHKEKALEEYKTSLNIDPSQTSLVLEICELLADDEVFIDPGRAKYWCDKAEAIFPRHPVTFSLRERLLASSNPDPEALSKLLRAELVSHPKDAILHARLIKHYLQNNKFEDAFQHSCDVEFGQNTFLNNYAWYETLHEVVKHQSNNIKDWQYELLLLTVLERLCILSLTETPAGSSKNLVESNKLLDYYDQALEKVAVAGAPPGYPEFHVALLQHHRGQFVFHSGTYLLKKAKKDQLSWRDATKAAAPLMLMAWHTIPLHTKVNWLTHAPEKQQYSVQRWCLEGSYRCSQSGHYLLAYVQDKKHSFIDQISQHCSGAHWRDDIYEKIFTNTNQMVKKKTSHFISNAFNDPIIRLPRKVEVEAYDSDAQRFYPNSLHHFIWILMNYQNMSDFKCTQFDMLIPKSRNYPNCGPETLNKLDILAFLYCAVFTSQQKIVNQNCYVGADKPMVPANITDMNCSLGQMKWWDCAYKFSRNELGVELTDIRTTLSRGIEVVRCVDNHGLDPELLCKLGHIFSEISKLSTTIDEKTCFENRAALYYSSAIPLLEKLKSKHSLNFPEKRMFAYTCKELSNKELTSLLEESKLYMGISFLNDSVYDKAIEMLNNLKSPKACFYITETYKKMALEEYNVTKENMTPEIKLKYATLLSKAKCWAHKTLEKLKEVQEDRSTMYTYTQEMIEDIEIHLNKLDPTLFDDAEVKYYSDENLSSGGSENIHVPAHTNSQVYRNFSSTPKHQSIGNVTNYRSVMESQLYENSRSLETIERQIKILQKRDSSINDAFMEQTKNWFDENRNLGNLIMNTIQSNIQRTFDQFKLLKLSVDQVKDQVFECRNDCKDVGDLKKEVAELKKEVNKLKKLSTEQTNNESDLYNTDDEFRNNDNPSTFPQMPFSSSQMLPPFSQRMVPSFPVPSSYQWYRQNLFNLYNQYSQFAQPPSVPGAPPIFDPSRPPLYPGVYPTPDQMFADMAHLIQPLSTSVPSPVTTTVTAPKTSSQLPKDQIRPLPVNVVITSSDPLPTCTTIPNPILSVTIPPEHIKGTPHNYQIQMPVTTNATQVIPPGIFTSNLFGSSIPSHPVFSLNQDVLTTTQSSNNSSPKVSSGLFDAFKMSGTFDTSATNVNTSNVLNTSLNKSFNQSRTLSEKSNTSVENYDPCPDFKPIIPLPAEVAVNTGEEDEIPLFASRAKLFRFVDKQWKERGLGEMKLLKHKATGKVRVLMRREQVHKVCANHIITPEMDIQPMKNETKAYFWVANDFADENVVLEKFCIRFKTADIAKQFYDVFDKACKDAKSINDSKLQPSITKTTAKSEPHITSTIKAEQNSKVEPPVSKTVIGGFTFSSAPTFKTIKDKDPKIPENKAPETKTTKSNPFSNITFKTSTSSPFSNLFNSSIQNTNNSSGAKQETTSKTNTSDIVEEFEPTIEFKPVVPLPALVDHKTGEEDEIILFEHRAKLLRFDITNKEWKERGLGNIKLLAQKEYTEKVRLLMRREQVMKVCCNHAITKEMSFQKMPNTDKAVTWCAKDFSEGQLVPETFCLRFKTAQTLDEFFDAVKSAQIKMKDDSKGVKEEQNAATQNIQVGFGDMFKPKQDSWFCQSCYTNNLDSFVKCACCEQPRPSTNEEKAKEEPSGASGWGDQFKPKPGTWECKECFVRNEKTSTYCNVCNNPRDPSVVNKENKPILQNVPKFKFGIDSQSSNDSSKKDTSGWGDKFKPKPDSWECQQCFVRNESNDDKCTCCSSPKDPSVKVESTSTFGILKGPTFSFGIPQNIDFGNVEQKQNTQPSIFAATGSPKFTFGIPFKQTFDTSNFAFGEGTVLTDKKSTETMSTPIKSAVPIDFSVTKAEESFTLKASNAPLLPTPKTESSGSAAFGTPGSGTFDFVFKPKSPQKVKSPMKSPKSEDSDGNEYTSDDEGHHIDFSPVIPLPDKVEIVTGEENENELLAHRAKLYRYCGKEWKERGTGVVKILIHKETKKLRVLMRREQVHKICLNHVLTPEVNYTPKDEKTWLFAANDYSEGELTLQRFCLRFGSKEMAQDFKHTIDEARKDNLIFDVVFVNEIQCSFEDKVKAKSLKLPENFYNYKFKSPCRGCRGCNDSDDSGSAASTVVTLASEQLTPPTDSPTNSVYATPSNNTIDTTIFRTPIETKSEANNTNKQISNKPATVDILHSNNKTDISLNSVFGNNNSTLTSVNKPLFSFAPDTKKEYNKPEVKSIFGESEQRPVNIFSGAGSIFGTTSNVYKPEIGFGTSGGSLFKDITITPSQNSIWTLGSNNDTQTSKSTKVEEVADVSITTVNPPQSDKDLDNKPLLFKVDNNLTFAALSTKGTGIIPQKNVDFKWEGTGQQIFSNNRGTSGDNPGAEYEYDPHYEPIVPLPDKIVVTTGEEDEQKLFGANSTLYRYDEKTREWKERGIGEMKILYHPERNTYRLLLRREQVHKTVLNTLLFMDLEIFPMNKTNRAWTWACRNFAEKTEGEQETLAVRFKSIELANSFKDKVVECVQKLQAAEAKAIREKNANSENTVPLLRLPKQMQNTTRVDSIICAGVSHQSNNAQEAAAAQPTVEERKTEQNGVNKQPDADTSTADYREPEEDQDYEDDHNYEDYDDENYEDYYNDEEECHVYFSCAGEVSVKQGNEQSVCPEARIQVMVDPTQYAPKIFITDVNTGEILADMLIQPEMEFQMDNNTCTWSGKDYTSMEPIDKMVVVNFPDSDTANQFYDVSEMSKQSSYTEAG